MITILLLARSRAEVRRDVANKLARARRQAAACADAGNGPEEMRQLALVEHLWHWLRELDRLDEKGRAPGGDAALPAATDG